VNIHLAVICYSSAGDMNSFRDLVSFGGAAKEVEHVGEPGQPD
jgi:hypothetical protein